MIAHILHSPNSGFLDGFFHPLTGEDHLIAMVAVGLWAAMNPGRVLWAGPAAFVGSMLAGAILPAILPEFAHVETLILASLVVFGVMIVMGRGETNSALATGLGMACIAFFGLFHGWAHASEMGSGISPAAYVVGFALCTSLLHASGIVVAIACSRFDTRIVRALGLLVIAAAPVIYFFA